MLTVGMTIRARLVTVGGAVLCPADLFIAPCTSSMTLLVT